MAQSTWAVASDYSDVIETPDGFGRFPTKLAAVERWIVALEVDRDELAERLSRAKRLRRSLKARKAAAEQVGRV